MGRQPSTNWHELKPAVASALRLHKLFPQSTQVAGRVEFLNAGLSHENLVFSVEADEPLPPGCDTLVLRRLRVCARGSSAALARLQSEAETSRALATVAPSLDAPRFVCFVHDADGVARGFIETAVEGIPLQWRTGNADKTRAKIDTIGRVAADVHRLPTGPFAFLPTQANAADHLSAELTVVGERCPRSDPAVADAIAWIRTHRSDGRPAVLLHGDLMPQNLLLDFDAHRPGVVDWEYARIGDPAYDLAIVTRGNRKLLGVSRGLRHLLAAYRAAGGALLESEDVVVWELLLVLRWLSEALAATRDGRSTGQTPAFYRDQLRAILRRA